MSNERVVVKFAQSWRGYSKGELAGFDVNQAEALIAGGVAELVKSGPKGRKSGTTNSKNSTGASDQQSSTSGTDQQSSDATGESDDQDDQDDKKP